MDQSFVTVAQFRDATMAELVKSKLIAEGIECHLQDENTIAVNWLWSDLLGGVKVRVRVQDAERARSMIDQDLSAAATAEEAAPSGHERGRPGRAWSARALESWADTGPERDPQVWARTRTWLLWGVMSAVAVWMALQ